MIYFGSYIAACVCIHNPENNTNNCELVPEEAHYCMVLLSQQYGLTFANSCILEF